MAIRLEFLAQLGSSTALCMLVQACICHVCLLNQASCDSTGCSLLYTSSIQFTNVNFQSHRYHSVDYQYPQGQFVLPSSGSQALSGDIQFPQSSGSMSSLFGQLNRAPLQLLRQWLFCAKTSTILHKYIIKCLLC